MFKDEDLESVEFKSSWKKERSLAENGCQTKDWPAEEVACQSIKRKHREVQTEDDRLKNVEFIEEDTPELAEFLRKTAPYMLKQLQRNLRSHAFDGFEANWEDETANVSNIHTLTYPEVTGELQVTGLAWNSTGSVIVASFGRFDHEDWCTHKSALCTWNLDRRNLNVNKPDYVIDISSCLLCISCHPTKPSLVVGGTFTGELIVWDTSKEDEPTIASTGIDDDTHREPVSKVQWALDPDSKGKKYHVVSISSDGRILVWRIRESKGTLKLVNGFVLLTENLPRSLKSRSARGDKEVGITCISFNKDDSDTFLIGSDSGGIFKCSKNARGTIASRETQCSVELRSPVTFTFAPHHGPVHGVECSPFHRNLFLSCGLDTTTRIYSMLLNQAIITIEPGAGYLYSAKWSPVRPLVFAASCENGYLLIYDLKHSRSMPIHKLEASPKLMPIYTMQFNHQQTQLLATGDGEGVIQIWRLSDELTHQSGKEVEILNELASSVME